MKAGTTREGLFFFPEVDDMGLTPQAFRLYFRLASRGTTTDILGQAQECGLSQREPEGALVELAQNELLTIDHR